MNVTRIYNKSVGNALVHVVMRAVVARTMWKWWVCWSMVGGALREDHVIGMLVEEEDGHEGVE